MTPNIAAIIRQHVTLSVSCIDRLYLHAYMLVGASSGAFNVRRFAADYPDRVAGLVFVDGSHEDQGHEVPGLARFVPALSTLGVLRLLGVQFGPRTESLAPNAQRFARATRFRASGYLAAANEIVHMQDTVAEVRDTRRRLTVPLVVVTGGRGIDPRWRELQQDLAALSERGCQIIAQQSGHVVALDQPAVVVEAIRTVVDAARGRVDAPLCGTNSSVGD